MDRLIIATAHGPRVTAKRLLPAGLGVRHLMGLPIVHTIRKRDSMPFDVQNFRTVIIDDEDMYDLIAKLDTYRADIANHAREALDTGESTDNPILTFLPNVREAGERLGLRLG